jgi:hypothetical protein
MERREGTMRIALLGAIMAVALTAAGRGAAAPAISGDYLEARSANVYIGACHAGAEYGTMGREAVLTWRFRGGEWEGTDLTGLVAVAIMSGSDNLARPEVQRHTVLYLDAKATPEQRAALLSLLRAKHAKTFGELREVKSIPITLAETAEGYRLRAGDLVSLDVAKEPNKSCCTMPMEVWYQPFVPVAGSKIGYTAVNTFKGAAEMPNWTRVGQNSAIFGSFSF